jgi:hypothetical protein
MNVWGRLGISVAIVATFSIVMTEILQDKAFYQVYRWAICAALLAMGAFLLVIGRFVNANIRESRRENDEEPKGPFLLVNLEYWGSILTIFGIIVIFIVPYKKVEARAVAARTNVPPREVVVAPTNGPPAPPPPKPVIFPPVKLQGIAYRQDRASALLNGRTYFVGDYIGEVKVISISPTNAVLELEGQQRELLLGD